MPKGEACRRQYRYRTRVLVGAWRPSMDAALDDAIRAGQARVDPGGQLHWIVPGAIETNDRDHGGRAAERDGPGV